MKCGKTACPNDAVAGVAIRVPALNCPIPEHDPIEACLGLALCDQHFQDVKAEDFLTDDGRLKEIIRMMARGRAEPDFGRAFIGRVAFDSPQWTMLAKKKPPEAGFGNPPE